MSYADHTKRLAMINGFRALADYLESDPEVPAPIYSTVYIFPSNVEWTLQRIEIDVIAARLGVPAITTFGGHYVALRLFGPVEYKAVAIPPDNERSE
jgi:hypothetical protein